MSTPMMECGHSANAEQYMDDGSKRPSCVICVGIHPGATVIAEPRNLEGRKARCAHNRDNVEGKRGSGRSSFPCKGEADSDSGLAFFEHRPDQPFDLYYCGCRGWD